MPFDFDSCVVLHFYARICKWHLAEDATQWISRRAIKKRNRLCTFKLGIAKAKQEINWRRRRRKKWSRLNHVKIKHNQHFSFQMENKVVKCLTTNTCKMHYTSPHTHKMRQQQRKEKKIRWIQDNAPYCQVDNLPTLAIFKRCLAILCAIFWRTRYVQTE